MHIDKALELAEQHGITFWCNGFIISGLQGTAYMGNVYDPSGFKSIQYLDEFFTDLPFIQFNNVMDGWHPVGNNYHDDILRGREWLHDEWRSVLFSYHNHYQKTYNEVHTLHDFIPHFYACALAYHNVYIDLKGIQNQYKYGIMLMVYSLPVIHHWVNPQKTEMRIQHPVRPNMKRYMDEYPHHELMLDGRKFRWDTDDIPYTFQRIAPQERILWAVEDIHDSHVGVITSTTHL